MLDVEPLYISEDALKDLLGVGRDKGREVIKALDNEGMPQKDPLLGKRYLPAIKAFLDQRNNLTVQSVPSTPDGKENW